MQWLIVEISDFLLSTKSPTGRKHALWALLWIALAFVAFFAAIGFAMRHYWSWTLLSITSLLAAVIASIIQFLRAIRAA